MNHIWGVNWLHPMLRCKQFYKKPPTPRLKQSLKMSEAPKHQHPQLLDISHTKLGHSKPHDKAQDPNSQSPTVLV